MQLLRRTLALLVGLALPLSLQAATRVLVITGGHEFEKPQFFKLFEDNTNIVVKAVEHPKAHEMFKPEHAGEYDVVVLYDMWQEITPEAQQNFASVIKSGKGLVAMHHCLASYQGWQEYEAMIGGKYHLDKWNDHGSEKPGSTYKHDLEIPVKVSKSWHPVIRGLKDYTIHDETYGGFSVAPEVTPLLTTDEPTSSKTIAWAKTYGKARVVYIESGHDHQAYENPNFQKLVAQAIEWVAAK